MSHIRLAKENFDQADTLETILTRRMFAVSDLTAKDSSPTTGDILICSDAYASKHGGRENIIELARQFRATKILILREHQPAFTMTTDLGGKLITIDLPKTTDQDPAMDYALNMAASLIDAEGHLATGCPSSVNMLTLAKKVAATDVTVFINGPTGTGKEVLSRFVHFHSARKDAPFVGINCAAIPENMLEAILFGHEKGAFTGASTANKGIFRAADKGTLLLDEISEMPLSLQAKLLRVLQERKVTPVGGQRDIDVDVRVLATSNRDMASEVNQSRFREDLYYRLNVFPLQTKNLSARKDDILPISIKILNKHFQENNTTPYMTG